MLVMQAILSTPKIPTRIRQLTGSLKIRLVRVRIQFSGMKSIGMAHDVARDKHASEYQNPKPKTEN
jgi:hypothetical protein